MRLGKFKTQSGKQQWFQFMELEEPIFLQREMEEPLRNVVLSFLSLLALVACVVAAMVSVW